MGGRGASSGLAHKIFQYGDGKSSYSLNLSARIYGQGVQLLQALKREELRIKKGGTLNDANIKGILKMKSIIEKKKPAIEDAIKKHKSVKELNKLKSIQGYAGILAADMLMSRYDNLLSTVNKNHLNSIRKKMGKE